MFHSLRYFLAPATGHRPPGVLFARVVRFVIAAILLSSAVLKTHQLTTEPLLGSGFLQSRWFLTVVVEYECFLAFWLISGLYPEVAWRVSFATFSVFAVVVTGKGIVGETSCGCFGRLPTSPWLALTIDLVAVVMLWSVRSLAGREITPGAACDQTAGRAPSQPRATGTRAIAAICVWLVTATGCGVAIANSRSGVVEAIGQRIGNTVVIEPERMVGRPFALGRYIDIGERLARGRWVVVLHRAGCPDCESLLRHSPTLDDACVADGVQLAVVLVPSRHSLAMPLDTPPNSAWGTLTADLDWFLTTPMIVAVENNRVLDVRCGATLSSLHETLSFGHTGDPRGAAGERSRPKLGLYPVG